MEDDAPAAQCLADRRALQQVVDTVEPLVLFQAGHADIIGRVDTEQDTPLCGVRGHPGRLFQPQTDTVPALILKGVQPHLRRVSRDVQAVFIALCGKAVAGACRAKPDLPIAHRVFPPRS